MDLGDRLTRTLKHNLSPIVIGHVITSANHLWGGRGGGETKRIKGCSSILCYARKIVNFKTRIFSWFVMLQEKVIDVSVDANDKAWM